MDENEKTKNQPSASQCEQFISFIGYDYPQGTSEGRFNTNRPFNNHEWKLSPWSVRYVFQEKEGKLFCELNHKMTNNRCLGWDYEENPLPRAEIKEVFPSSLF